MLAFNKNFRQPEANLVMRSKNFLHLFFWTLMLILCFGSVPRALAYDLARDALVRSIGNRQPSSTLDEEVLQYLRSVTPADHPILVEVAIEYILERKPSGFKPVLIDILEDRVHVAKLDAHERFYATGIRRIIVDALPQFLGPADGSILAGIQRGWGRSMKARADGKKNLPRLIFHDFVIANSISSDQLLVWLNHSDPGLRMLAVYELDLVVDSHSTRVMSALSEALLGDPDVFVRMAIIEHSNFAQLVGKGVIIDGLTPIADGRLVRPEACEVKAFTALRTDALKLLVGYDEKYWALLTSSYNSDDHSTMTEWVKKTRLALSDSHLQHLCRLNLGRISKAASSLLQGRKK